MFAFPQKFSVSNIGTYSAKTHEEQVVLPQGKGEINNYLIR